MLELLKREKNIENMKFENEIIDFEKSKDEIKDIDTEVIVENCEFIDCEFKNIEFTESPNFYNCKFINCKFENAEMFFKFSNFENCKFENIGECIIKKSKIERTTIRNTKKTLKLEDTEIKESDLINCTISIREV